MRCSSTALVSLMVVFSGAVIAIGPAAGHSEMAANAGIAPMTYALASPDGECQDNLFQTGSDESLKLGLNSSFSSVKLSCIPMGSAEAVAADAVAVEAIDTATSAAADIVCDMTTETASETATDVATDTADTATETVSNATPDTASAATETTTDTAVDSVTDAASDGAKDVAMETASDHGLDQKAAESQGESDEAMREEHACEYGEYGDGHDDYHSRYTMLQDEESGAVEETPTPDSQQIFFTELLGMPGEQSFETTADPYLRDVDPSNRLTADNREQPTSAPLPAMDADQEVAAVIPDSTTVAETEPAKYQYDYTYDEFIMAETREDAAEGLGAGDQIAETQEAARKTLSYDTSDGYPWDAEVRRLDSHASGAATYRESPWNSRVGLSIDFSVQLPGEWLTAEDCAFLRLLGASTGELSQTRRCMVNEYLAALGWGGQQFVAQFEASSGQDAGAYGDDLPMLAALLAGFRLVERGDLSDAEAIEMLRETLDSLPQQWIDEVEEISTTRKDVSDSPDGGVDCNPASGNVTRNERLQAAEAWLRGSLTSFQQGFFEVVERVRGLGAEALAGAVQQQRR